jgi:hypothetical protein
MIPYIFVHSIFIKEISKSPAIFKRHCIFIISQIQNDYHKVLL